MTSPAIVREALERCRYCGGAGRFQIVSPVSDHAWADCFCTKPAALAALDATPGEGVLMPREQLRDWYTQAFAMFVALTPEDDEDDRRTPKLMSEMEALLAPANPASEPVQ